MSASVTDAGGSGQSATNPRAGSVWWNAVTSDANPPDENPPTMTRSWSTGYLATTSVKAAWRSRRVRASSCQVKPVMSATWDDWIQATMNSAWSRGETQFGFSIAVFSPPPCSATKSG